METLEKTATRRPRFRRGSGAPAFRITDGDIEIVRLLARHRFLRSTHIASLVGRSLDRTNDRLLRLFHGGYVDRPRAQLDRYPSTGSAPMVYALADRGARLLGKSDGEHSKAERSRNNLSISRPFIEHQLEIMEFYVALECAAKNRGNVRIIHAEEIVRSFPKQPVSALHPFALSAPVSCGGGVHVVGVVPDLVFGLLFQDGSRRCFMVEIDRGTMPILRRDIQQTSFERKLRVYLAAYTAKEHERHLGWKTFRVLVVTTNVDRLRSMMTALATIGISSGIETGLFWFATRHELTKTGPLTHGWVDGSGRSVQIL